MNCKTMKYMFYVFVIVIIIQEHARCIDCYRSILVSKLLTKLERKAAPKVQINLVRLYSIEVGIFLEFHINI